MDKYPNIFDFLIFGAVFGCVILSILIIVHPSISHQAEQDAAVAVSNTDKYNLILYSTSRKGHRIYQTGRLVEINENNEMICYTSFVKVEQIKKGFIASIKSGSYRAELLNTTQPCD